MYPQNKETGAMHLVTGAPEKESEREGVKDLENNSIDLRTSVVCAGGKGGGRG